jgi:hypothetical protein
MNILAGSLYGRFWAIRSLLQAQCRCPAGTCQKRMGHYICMARRRSGMFPCMKMNISLKESQNGETSKNAETDYPKENGIKFIRWKQLTGTSFRNDIRCARRF